MALCRVPEWNRDSLNKVGDVQSYLVSKYGEYTNRRMSSCFLRLSSEEGRKDLKEFFNWLKDEQNQKTEESDESQA